jgi:hypothetical protein
MIQQDKQSWSKGCADAMRGAPSKCPKGLDGPGRTIWWARSQGWLRMGVLGEAPSARRECRGFCVFGTQSAQQAIYD